MSADYKQPGGRLQTGNVKWKNVVTIEVVTVDMFYSRSRIRSTTWQLYRSAKRAFEIHTFHMYSNMVGQQCYLYKTSLFYLTYFLDI